MDIAVRSDVIHIGKSWEDGEPIEALNYYVLARAPDGRQWVHTDSRINRSLHWDDEHGIDYIERHENAEPDCEQLAARIRAHLERGGLLKLGNEEFWVEIDPAYGSEAYQELDRTGYFRTMEIMRAEDAGEIAVGSVPYF